MLNVNTYKAVFKSYGHVLLLLMAVLLLPACSAVPPVEPVDGEPAMHPIDSIVKDDVEYAIDIYDPWEGMNRNIYIFNAELDRYVLIPVVTAYEDYIPWFLRAGVDNFFSNLASINHTINSALQLNGEATVNNGLRFISNSTMGIAGIFDIATQMDLPEMKEDFGQTLGYWGVGNGPYLMLPVLGPSNLRDTSGIVVDAGISSWYLDELGLNADKGWEYFYFIMLTINTRSETPFRYYASGSPFEYEMMRWLYTSARQAMIGRE